jgi:hypothetical protein
MATGREDSKSNNEDKPGCLGTILQALGLAPETTDLEALPYRVRDDFLSPAELSFYHVLRAAVGDWAVVCSKVSLADLFYARSGSHKVNTSYTNRIARKHVDFLVCDPQSMKPLLGIELDDSSHSRTARKRRDDFVDLVFAAAGLPLLRQTVQPTYNVRGLSSTLRSLASKDQQIAAQMSPRPTLQGPLAASPPEAESVGQPVEASPQASPGTEGAPLCPKCGRPMVLRTVQKEGLRKGSRFWGCPSYPQCHGIRELAPEDRG